MITVEILEFVCHRETSKGVRILRQVLGQMNEDDGGRIVSGGFSIKVNIKNNFLMENS
jgi:hypothetical protein